MIDPHNPLELSRKLEKLTQRYELFKLLKESHVQWMNTTNDPKVREVHRVIVAQFEALMQQYDVLMDALHAPP